MATRIKTDARLEGQAAPTKKRVARQVEHNLQSQLVACFERLIPRRRALIFAVPNAARRSPAVAGMLKKEGMRAGVADLIITCRRQGDPYPVLFVEVKRPLGKGGRTTKPSERQVEFGLDVIALGHCYRIVSSMDEFLAVLREAGLLPKRG